VEVDQKIAAQMEEFLKTPETIPHRTYFEAAQYYLHNNRDLKEALTWIDAALIKSPENARYGLLKAKIQAKNGDSSAAMVTINQANTWAVNASNDNYIEQTALFRQSLLEKK
jgi:lipopolysaccharide biosynthesis regulator YciM